MTSTFARADLERQRYWQGQRLRSGDLNDQLAAEAQQRWWHNRAVHNAYGVADGLRLDKFGETVWLSPGVAYDGHGREIVLSDWITVGLPPAETREERGWTLLASVPHERASGATATSLTGELELRWQPTREVAHSICPDSVPLIRLDADFEPVDRGRRPLARPLARPRIGHGATVPGKTAWRAWRLSLFHASAEGIEVTVDTSAVGFSAVPCYFASLQGVPNGLVLPRILEATGESFTYSLWTPGIRRSEALLPVALRELSVSWIGIERCCPDRTEGPPNEVNNGFLLLE